MHFRPKQCIFSPKKGHFGQSGPENGPPSGPTGTYKKTEGIQSYLRTWGRYDLIESGLSEAKKMSYVGVALKKKQIFGPKMQYFGPKIRFLIWDREFCHKTITSPRRW